MATARQQAAAPASVSFRPSLCVQGGLLDDADVEIVSAATEMYDYEGKADEPATTVAIGFQALDTAGNPEGEVVIEHLSAGKDFVPDAAGTGFVATGTATAMRKGSNWIMFITSLVNCGFDENQIDNDVTCFVGLRCHINRIPAPKRAGLKQNKENATILVATNGPSGGPLVLPYETAAAPKAGVRRAGATQAAAAAPKATAAAGAAPAARGRVTAAAPPPVPAPEPEPAAGGVEDVAAQTLVDLIAAANGTLKKATLRSAAFKALGKTPDVRNDVLALFADEQWLSSVAEANNIGYDGTEFVALG